MNRRTLLQNSTLSLGSIALGTLINGQESNRNSAGGLPHLPHNNPKVKRVIYLFSLVDHPSWISSITNQTSMNDLVRKSPNRSTLTSARLL